MESISDMDVAGIVALLIAGFAVILGGAGLFTNAVEWLGRRLNLNQGAVGSVFAAVGTAMPETLVPIIALVFGGSADREAIGIGAILGAPFMLSTLAFFITGVAIFVYARKGRRPAAVLASPQVMRRDLEFFILVYVLVVAAGVLDLGRLKYGLAVALFGLYALYVYRTVTQTGMDEIETDPPPLLFARMSEADRAPALGLIVLQLLVALAALIGGAKIFVSSISFIAVFLGVPAFVLAVIIAPIATELPEKLNSVIWISQKKDTLALGNITGAMVFQSSMIPAIGMLLTPWSLSGLELATAFIALASAATVYVQVRRYGKISPYGLLLGGLFYVVFIVAVILMG
jgi:cation:H+ antiporter